MVAGTVTSAADQAMSVEYALAYSGDQPRPERQPVESQQPRPTMNIVPQKLLCTKPDGLAGRQCHMRNARQLDPNLDRRVSGANDHYALALKWRRMPIRSAVQHLPLKDVLTGELGQMRLVERVRGRNDAPPVVARTLPCDDPKAHDRLLHAYNPGISDDRQLKMSGALTHLRRDLVAHGIAVRIAGEERARQAGIARWRYSRSISNALKIVNTSCHL